MGKSKKKPENISTFGVLYSRCTRTMNHENTNNLQIPDSYLDNFEGIIPPQDLVSFLEPSEVPHTFFNKLAQLSHSEKSGQNVGIFEGITDAKKYHRRANAKVITLSVLNALTTLESPLKKSYEQSKSCASVVLKDAEKLTSSYCNNRWCLVCNRIRTGKLINGYGNSLDALPDKYFITLSRPNVKEELLPNEILFYQKQWRKVYKKIKDKLRKTDLKIQGIKKIECTYNSEENTYHPHYHIVCNDELVSEMILQFWLEINPTSQTTANKIFPVYGNDSYKEIFKYFTKFWSTRQIEHKHKYYQDTRKKKRKTLGDIYIHSLDVIFRSMYRKRVFEAFGINKQVSEEVEAIKTEYFNLDSSNDIFCWSGEDWLNGYDYELSGHRTSELTKLLIQKIIY